MAKLTYRIELTIHDRDLMLKYGYVSGRLEASLCRWPKGQVVRRVGMDRVEFRWLINDLTHSCKTGN